MVKSGAIIQTSQIELIYSLAQIYLPKLLG